LLALAQEEAPLQLAGTMLRRPVLGGAVDLEDNNEPEEEKPAYQGSFWQRKIIQPIKSVFTQGISPDALALSIAFGLPPSRFCSLSAKSHMVSFL